MLFPSYSHFQLAPLQEQSNMHNYVIISTFNTSVTTKLISRILNLNFSKVSNFHNIIARVYFVGAITLMIRVVASKFQSLHTNIYF